MSRVIVKKGKSPIWKRLRFAALVIAVSFGIGLKLPLFHLFQFQHNETKDFRLVGTTEANHQVEGLKGNTQLDKNLTFSVPEQFQGVTVYSVKPNVNEKVIALTFDDGPWPKTTGQVLDILQQNNIKATFFWVGQMVQNYPQIAQQVVAKGHAIGNHTWHHWYRKMDAVTAKSEIDRTGDAIYRTTGVRTSLFRPPGGFLHNGVTDYAKQQKYAIVMWSVASGDAERHPVEPAFIKNVLKEAKSGSIILMHDGGGNRAKTVQALPEIISSLRQRGYRFVTVPELLGLYLK